jgi:type IV fimbrial biogenesis protein FimT
VLKHPRPRGFSLIELMIALTIFGISLMLALPSFTEWLQGQHIRVAAEAVTNGLQVARAEAIRRNVLTQIVFGPGSGWAVTEVASAAAVQSRPAEEGSANAVITTTPANTTTVTFTPLGSVTTNLDTTNPVTQIDIANPNIGGACQPGGPMRCLRVLISGGGRIKMCDPHPAIAATDPRFCA